MRTPAAKAPIEKKVALGTLGAYAGSLALVAVLGAVGSDPLLVSSLPDWAQAILLPLIPAAIAFASGWLAKHTPRPDLSGADTSPVDTRMDPRDLGDPFGTLGHNDPYHP